MLDDNPVPPCKYSAVSGQRNWIARKKALLDFQVLQRIALPRDGINPMNLCRGRKLVVRHSKNLESLYRHVAGLHLYAVGYSPKRIWPAHPGLRKRHNWKQNGHPCRGPVSVI